MPRHGLRGCPRQLSGGGHRQARRACRDCERGLVACADAVGQVLTLVDIENRVLAHHRDQARGGGIVRAFVPNVELLHEIDFRAVLALADVAAQLQGLFEG